MGILGVFDFYKYQVQCNCFFVFFCYVYFSVLFFVILIMEDLDDLDDENDNVVFFFGLYFFFEVVEKQKCKVMLKNKVKILEQQVEDCVLCIQK